jgi:lipoic acid synthetase
MNAVPKPEWLKIRPPTSEQFQWIKSRVSGLRLHTVCQEAHCPNMAECWSAGTASFMILGDTCTRGCRFCAVKTAAKGKEVDSFEPLKLAQTVHEMNLKYVVITSVDRDELQDQGAEHFAKCVSEIKKTNPETRVEVLVPDFRGSTDCIETVLNARPDVFGHNLETVKRLQSKARDRRANYEQSLSVLRLVSKWNKKNNEKIFTKSALMLGMGEEKTEVLEAMDDLREAGVEILSLGQYLQPSPNHYPLDRYVSPTEFGEFKQTALEKGFLFCQAGPFVRSSYKAGEFFVQSQLAKNK